MQMPDGSIIVQIINFVFLMWVLNIVLYKPVRNVLLQRKEKISGLEQRIETFNSDAKEKDEAFLSGIKEARAKGIEEKNTFIESARNEEKEIIERIKQKAHDDLEATRAGIVKDAETVGKSLEEELNIFAGAIGRKLLGRSINAPVG